MIRHLLTLTVALSFVSSLASAALSPSDKQSIPYENRAASVNSGFENGISKWVSSPAITLASATPQAGSKYAQWNSTSAAQTLTLGSIGRPEGQLEVSCAVRVPSGTATHTFSVVESSGSTTVASMSIENSTTWRYQTLIFPSPSAGTLSIVFTSVAADEPSIDIDDCYVGRARNVGSTQLITEWTSYTPTGSWTTNTTYTGQWRRVGGQYEFRIRLALGGAPTATGLTVNFLSSACSAVDTSKNNGTTAPKYIGYGSIRSAGSDSAAIVAYTSGTAATIIVPNTASTYIASSTAVSNTLPATFTSGDAVEITGSVPCVGWAASTVVMPNAQGWYVDANISGANPSLGTSNVSSYTEITNGSLTMTPRTGSAAAGIMCSSTNAAATPTTSTSTCSAGSESVGLNAVIPVSGAYEVCADFSHYMEADQAEGVNTAFQIVQTPTNAQTITTEGGSRKSGRNAPLAIATGTAQAINVPYTVCGIFQLSAGTNGFRLMYEQLVTGTPNGSEVLADELSTVGQRNMRFTIKPINSQQQAILANSVSTSATNGLKIESFSFTCSGSSSIAVQLGGTSWVSSIGNIAAGVCAVGISAGTFSGSPQCQVTWTGGGSNAIVYSYAEASSGFNVGAVTDTGAAATSFTGKAMCVGPR